MLRVGCTNTVSAVVPRTQETPNLVSGLRILYDLLGAGPSAAKSTCNVAIRFCGKIMPPPLGSMAPLTFFFADLFNNSAFGEVDPVVPLFMNHLAAAILIFDAEVGTTDLLAEMYGHDDSFGRLLPVGVAGLCMYHLKKGDFLCATTYYNRLQAIECEPPSKHSFELKLEGIPVFFPTRAPRWYEVALRDMYAEKMAEGLLIDPNVFGLE